MTAHGRGCGLRAPARASRPTSRPRRAGCARDAVRMMVADARRRARSSTRASPTSRRSSAPGDLVVVNTSATLPAAIDATRRRRHRRSTCTSPPERPTRRAAVGASSCAARRRGAARGGARAASGSRSPAARTVDARSPPTRAATRLWLASVDARRPAARLPRAPRRADPLRLRRRGAGRSPTTRRVYATEPGSAEMPSAGRPFTPELVTRLVATGVGVAPIVLHTGVSSLEARRAALPRAVPRARRDGARASTRRARPAGGWSPSAPPWCARSRRVADADGVVAPGRGLDRAWSSTPERGVRAVDGLLTGWHEPEASHLLMLEAIAGPRAARASLRRGARRRLPAGTSSATVHLILP